MKKKVIIPVAVGAVGAIAGLGVLVFSPHEFSAHGTFTLANGVTQYAPSGGECKGYQGYDDIDSGTSVTISSSGTTVAKGNLSNGKYDGGFCTFDFTITGVPTGSKFYGVQVSHRGEMQYSQQELEKGVQLSLGG